MLESFTPWAYSTVFSTSRQVSQNAVTLETQCNWMATLIDYILITLDLMEPWHCASMYKMFRDQKVSKKCNQSRWPSNCTGFHSHHVRP